MLHTVRIYLILHAVNDNVLSLTTIHNEHCVNVLSCLIGIQLPIQLTALARYIATQLRMYTIRYARTSCPSSTPRTHCFPPFMCLTRRTLLSSGSLLLISSQGHTLTTPVHVDYLDSTSHLKSGLRLYNIYILSIIAVHVRKRQAQADHTLPAHRAPHY